MNEEKNREDCMDVINIRRYFCPKKHDVPYTAWNMRPEAVDKIIDKKGNPLYEASLYCFKCDIRYRISQLEKAWIFPLK